MKEGSENDRTRPIPREWLPDPQPSEDDASWGERTADIMAVARSELRILASRRSAAEATWWTAMSLWWKPAAVLAAASIALLVLLEPRFTSSQPPAGSISLGLVASAGDPVAFWEALGIQADPVLALIAVSAQTEVAGESAPSVVPQEERP